MEIFNNDPQEVIRFGWTIHDGVYVYMDTWEMTKEEWNALSPEVIKHRQEEQYAKWRAHMDNPGA